MEDGAPFDDGSERQQLAPVLDHFEALLARKYIDQERRAPQNAAHFDANDVDRELALLQQYLAAQSGSLSFICQSLIKANGVFPRSSVTRAKPTTRDKKETAEDYVDNSVQCLVQRTLRMLFEVSSVTELAGVPADVVDHCYGNIEFSHSAAIRLEATLAIGCLSQDIDHLTRLVDRLGDGLKQCNRDEAARAFVPYMRAMRALHFGFGDRAAATTAAVRHLSTNMPAIERGVLREEICTSIRAIAAAITGRDTMLGHDAEEPPCPLVLKATAVAGPASAVAWAAFQETPQALLFWSAYDDMFKTILNWARRPKHAAFCQDCLIAMMSIGRLETIMLGDGLLKKFIAGFKDKALRLASLERVRDYFRAINPDIAAIDKTTLESQIRQLVPNLLPKKTQPAPSEIGVLSQIFVEAGRKHVLYILNMISDVARSEQYTPGQKLFMMRALGVLTREFPAEIRGTSYTIAPLIDPILTSSNDRDLLCAAIPTFPTLRNTLPGTQTRIMDRITALAVGPDDAVASAAVTALTDCVREDPHGNMAAIIVQLCAAGLTPDPTTATATAAAAAAASTATTAAGDAAGGGAEIMTTAGAGQDAAGRTFRALSLVLGCYSQRKSEPESQHTGAAEDTAEIDAAAWLQARHEAESACLAWLSHPDSSVRSEALAVVNAFAEPELIAMEGHAARKAGIAVRPRLADVLAGAAVHAGEAEGFSQWMKPLTHILADGRASAESHVPSAWHRLAAEFVARVKTDQIARPEDHNLFRNHLRFLCLACVPSTPDQGSNDGDHFFAAALSLLAHQRDAVKNEAGRIIGTYLPTDCAPELFLQIRKRCGSSDAAPMADPRFALQYLDVFYLIARRLEAAAITDPALVVIRMAYIDLVSFWCHSDGASRPSQLSHSVRLAVAKILSIYFQHIAPLLTKEDIAPDVVTDTARQFDRPNVAPESAAYKRQVFAFAVGLLPPQEADLESPQSQRRSTVSTREQRALETEALHAFESWLALAPLADGALEDNVVAFLIICLSRGEHVHAAVGAALAAFLRVNRHHARVFMQRTWDWMDAVEMPRDADEEPPPPPTEPGPSATAHLDAFMACLTAAPDDWIAWDDHGPCDDDSGRLPGALALLVVLLHQNSPHPGTRAKAVALANALGPRTTWTNLPAATSTEPEVYTEFARRWATAVAAASPTLFVPVLAAACDTVPALPHVLRDALFSVLAPFASLANTVSDDDRRTGLGALLDLTQYCVSDAAAVPPAGLTALWTAAGGNRSTPALAELIVTRLATAGAAADPAMLSAVRLAATLACRTPHGPAFVAEVVTRLRSYHGLPPSDPAAFLDWASRRSDGEEPPLASEAAAFTLCETVAAERGMEMAASLPVLLQNALILFGEDGRTRLISDLLTSLEHRTAPRPGGDPLEIRDAVHTLIARRFTDPVTGARPTEPSRVHPPAWVTEIVDVLEPHSPGLRQEWAATALEWALQTTDTAISDRSLSLHVSLCGVPDADAARRLALALAAVLRGGRTAAAAAVSDVLESAAALDPESDDGDRLAIFAGVALALLQADDETLHGAGLRLAHATLDAASVPGRAVLAALVAGNAAPAGSPSAAAPPAWLTRGLCRAATHKQALALSVRIATAVAGSGPDADAQCLAPLLALACAAAAGDTDARATGEALATRCGGAATLVALFRETESGRNTGWDENGDGDGDGDEDEDEDAEDDAAEDHFPATVTDAAAARWGVAGVATFCAAFLADDGGDGPVAAWRPLLLRVLYSVLPYEDPDGVIVLQDIARIGYRHAHAADPATTRAALALLIACGARGATIGFGPEAGEDADGGSGSDDGSEAAACRDALAALLLNVFGLAPPS